MQLGGPPWLRGCTPHFTLLCPPLKEPCLILQAWMHPACVPLQDLFRCPEMVPCHIYTGLCFCHFGSLVKSCPSKRPMGPYGSRPPAAQDLITCFSSCHSTYHRLIGPHLPCHQSVTSTHAVPRRYYGPYNIICDAGNMFSYPAVSCT